MKGNGQLRFYRAIWAEICEAQGWANLPTAERDTKRRALHEQLRLPQSSTQFSHGDFTAWDRDTRQMRGKPAAKPVQRQQRGTERDQLFWRIREDAKLANFPAAYLNKIAYDRFTCLVWEELPTHELRMFRNAIHDRASKVLGHDTRTTPKAVQLSEPEDDNIPF